MFQIPNHDPKDRINRFFFRVPRRRIWHRREYSIPYLHYVPLDVMREARKADKPMQMHDVCVAIGEKAAARAIGRLNQPEIRALEVAWLEGSMVTLGESAASSNSSNSSGRPSARTSSASATA